MSILFTPIKINQLKIPNRFYRSATFEALSNNNGDCTSDIIKLYMKFKSVGLIMSSCTQVDDRGQHHPTMLSLSPRSSSQRNVDHYNTFKKLADEIHKQGLCFGVQLAHPGLLSKSYLIQNMEPEGPNTMSISDIERVIDSFATSAYLAYNYGADAVQIHGASIFLVGSFLSKVTNKRKDEFGGSIEKRCELMRRIIRKIRSKVPSGFPVLLKINGGTEKAYISPEDQAIISQIAENAGIDAIEIAVEKKIKEVYPSHFSEFGSEAAHFASRSNYDYSPLPIVKKAVSVPIISTGGHLDLRKMDAFVSSGLCDMIGLSRPLIRQPNLVDMFKNGTAQCSTCIQCDGCLGNTSVREKPLKCVNY